MASMAFDHRATEKLVGLASLDVVCPPEMLAQHKLLELQKIMGGKPLKVGAQIDVPCYIDAKESSESGANSESV
jgi:hypothetical protein